MSGGGLPEQRKVLVTGAGGFIGSHLAADQVRRGHRVVALDLTLDRLADLQTSERVDLVEGDVTDPRVLARALREVDTVYHLAATHLTVQASEREFRRVNVEGIQTLVDACRFGGVRRLVHCSTVGVFGDVKNPPADEDAPCNPTLPYERTKLDGEKIVSDSCRMQGLPAVILRPAWVYGPGCPRTEKLLRSVARGRFAVAGSGSNLRHCVYIRDMVEALNLAAGSDRALGQVIIVGDNEAVTVRQLVGEIAKVTGSRRPPRIPRSVLYAGAVAVELVFRFKGKEPPFSRRTLKFFDNTTAFDISRARRLLGFAPRYDLAGGLRETQAILETGDYWHVPLPEPATG
jgi:nucleoside-diphosphate-sugar epimerase